MRPTANGCQGVTAAADSGKCNGVLGVVKVEVVLFGRKDEGDGD
jgi:hypothetical protein